MILITHDVGQGHTLADDILVLRRGKVVFSEPKSSLSEKDLRESYFSLIGERGEV